MLVQHGRHGIVVGTGVFFKDLVPNNFPWLLTTLGQANEEAQRVQTEHTCVPRGGPWRKSFVVCEDVGSSNIGLYQSALPNHRTH